MKIEYFVPQDFEPPERYEHPDFVMRKLTARDVELDYAAVMSSIDIIHQTRSEGFPDPELTLEEDRIDLSWHQREFEMKTSFAFTLMNHEETECLGCVYFYPPSKPWITAPEGTDVVINFWVTQKAYDQGLYSKVWSFLKKITLSGEWPWQQIYWSNKVLP